MKKLIESVREFVGVHVMRLGLRLMGHDPNHMTESITRYVNPTNDPDVSHDDDEKEIDVPVQVAMSKKALEQITFGAAPKPPTNTSHNGHKRGSVASRMKS